jgi:hypothetical protein
MPQENKRLGGREKIKWSRVSEWRGGGVEEKTQAPGKRVGHRPRSKRDSGLRRRRSE